ncbi:hypothetical protein EZV62_015288 [Acer yangbiense]|uniref:NPK1-activating kinesin-like protein C-terminal domain-containing protein n=1 Tax=Acer yangbiense TaxID=1000413 RepID=A0A5C7HKW0_9ROSI|nr:hypothetical protein EZV62_015288 [Acer yangbiense]
MEMRSVQSVPEEVEVGSVIAPNRSVSANLKEEITRLHSQGSTIANLEEQLESVQKSIDKPVMSLPSNNQHPDTEAIPKAKNQSKKRKLLPLASSNVVNRQNFIKSPCSPLSTSRQILDSEIGNRAPENDYNMHPVKLCQSLRVKKVEMSHQRKPLQALDAQVRTKRMRGEIAIPEAATCLPGMILLLSSKYQTHVLEMEANEAAGYSLEDDEIAIEPEEPQVSWHITFREQRQQIIELWDVCHVSINQRTQFYLLFKGDPAD